MNFFQRLFSKKPKGDPENPTEAKKLPEILPLDFQINIRSSGTWVMESESISVSNNVVTSQKSNKDISAEFEYHLAKDQMEKLFAILKTNKYDKIKIIEDIRLDYPSDTFSVCWNGHYIYKGESQTEYIHKDWEDVYHKCKFAVLDSVRDGLKDKIKRVKVRFAEGLINDDDEISIFCTDSLTRYYYRNYRLDVLDDDTLKREKCGPPADIPVLLDYSLFGAHLERKEKKLPEIKIVFPEGEYDTITFYEENNELRWKLS